MTRRLVLILFSYLLFPLTVVFVGIDQFFDFGIMSQLPEVPEYWLWFNFIFNTPHVVATNLLVHSDDSWNEYKQRFLVGWAVVFTITMVAFYILRWKYFLYVYSLLTLKHIILQQFSLTYMVGMKRAWLNRVWMSTGLAIGLVIYWEVYKNYDINLPHSHVILTSLLVLFAFASIYLFSKSQGLNLKRMVAANSGMIVSSYFSFILGGGFLTVLAVRAVHDITGFVHYVEVFKTRRLENKSAGWYNFAYKILKSDWAASLGVPVLIVILMLVFIPQGREKMSLLMMMSLMHYYLESFTWKSGSSYRRQLKP